MTPFTARLKRTLNFSFLERQIFSFLLAFVGVVYELSFAQMLSATLGNTALRYATTIGLFTLTLGLSSILYDRWKIALPYLQLSLVAVGALGPLWIIVADPKNFPESFYSAMEVLSYVPIIAAGFISGFELPWLMDNVSGNRKSFILAWDYFGMFIGTLVFPLFLLPVWGVSNSLYFCALLNAVAFAYLLTKVGKTP
ncbi:hypothetical protein [Bdellovibrio bacteriovorus]|uniref:hypothetical protein n=1 Tax=Bdellovibrio TaxID=958 RepID=UPI0035A91340